jgi:hypothetical protein
VRESRIEARLRRRVQGMGGKALKLDSSSEAGLPDRLILLPGGRVAFAETKAPGAKMRELQKYRQRELEALGFQVVCIDSVLGVEEFVEEVMPLEVHTAQLPAVRHWTCTAAAGDSPPA